MATPGDEARHNEATVEFSAGPLTDWFRDPRTGTVTQNAPMAIVADRYPVTVSCTVTATLRSTFDAAGVFVHVDDEHWVKLALERSPEGRSTTDRSASPWAMPMVAGNCCGTARSPASGRPSSD